MSAPGTLGTLPLTPFLSDGSYCHPRGKGFGGLMPPNLHTSTCNSIKRSDNLKRKKKGGWSFSLTEKENTPSRDCVINRSALARDSLERPGVGNGTSQASLPGSALGRISQAFSGVQRARQSSCPWFCLLNFQLHPSSVSKIPNILIKCDRDTELFGLHRGEHLGIWKHLKSLPKRIINKIK